MTQLRNKLNDGKDKIEENTEFNGQTNSQAYLYDQSRYADE